MFILLIFIYLKGGMINAESHVSQGLTYSPGFNESQVLDLAVVYNTTKVSRVGSRGKAT